MTSQPRRVRFRDQEEDRIRYLAARQGLALRKSRARIWRANNQLGYRIIAPHHNLVIAGERFDLSLDEVAEVLAGRQSASLASRRT
jgi:hypothetical protein